MNTHASLLRTQFGVFRLLCQLSKDRLAAVVRASKDNSAFKFMTEKIFTVASKAASGSLGGHFRLVGTHPSKPGHLQLGARRIGDSAD